MPNIADIVKSLTPEQKAVYDNMLGNDDKLRADWTGCRKMYSDAMAVINDKNTGPVVRLFLRNISDYWNRRQLDMERLLRTMGKGELLDTWRKEDKNAKG